MQRTSFAQNVARFSVIAVALVLAALWFTRHAWFDNANAVVQHQVDVIAQLAVGLGTGLLAVITWASVYETQAVLAGEDMRFRQSRMPMLRLVEPPSLDFTNKTASAKVVVRNVGDGFARSATVLLKGSFVTRWKENQPAGFVLVSSDDANSFTDANSVKHEDEIKTPGTPASSFVPVGGEATALVDMPVFEVPGGVAGIFTRRFLFVKRVEIEYRDAFGEVFMTTYLASAGRIDFKGFTWDPPRSYGFPADRAKQKKSRA